MGTSIPRSKMTQTQLSKVLHKERLGKAMRLCAECNPGLTADTMAAVRKRMNSLPLERMSQAAIDEKMAEAIAVVLSRPSANQFAKSATITKFDEEKMLASAVVYLPDEPDTQGDFMDAETLEKAAFGFMKSGATENVDIEHNLRPTGSAVVESFIAKQGDALFPEGSWVATVKATPEVWEDIKSGRLNGFSIYGSGQRTPIVKDGRELNQLSNVNVTHISLVRRGANRQQFEVIKTAAKPNEKPLLNPGNGKTMSKKIDVEAIATAVAKSVESALDGESSVKKEGREGVRKTAVQIERLQAELHTLNERLLALWSSSSPGALKPQEDRLLAMIEAKEAELASLRSPQDLSSAFDFRGGQSLNGGNSLLTEGQRRSNMGVQFPSNEADPSPTVSPPTVDGLSKSAMGSNQESDDGKKIEGKGFGLTL